MMNTQMQFDEVDAENTTVIGHRELLARGLSDLFRSQIVRRPDIEYIGVCVVVRLPQATAD